MHAEPKRWRRATTISVALHVALAAWLWFVRPGTAILSMHWYDLPGLRDAPVDLILIEPTTIAMPDAWTHERGPADRPRTSEISTRASGTRPSPKRTPRAPSPNDNDGGSHSDNDLLHGRDARGSTGLLGSGVARPGVDPELLRGSGTLLAASMPNFEGEGPRRPTPSERPSNDYAFEREGGKWIYRHADGSFVATLQPDGGVTFRNQLIEVKVGSMPSVARDGEEFVTLEIEHDAVGLAQLARGRDPSPRAKAALLSATFEMRLEIATEYHQQRLLDQLNGLADKLETIWYASGRSVAERKRLLFERWDECEEASGDVPGFEGANSVALDERRRAYAKGARAKILRFIRGVLPVDGEDAFTTSELAELNRRRVSTQAFAPYD